MPYYSVIEGEGVAGPLTTVSAETTALSTCMGIVFHNSATNTAGLYHYGGGSLHDPLTQNTILQMIGDIQPEEVYVTAPPVTSWGTGAYRQDRRAVDNFLLMNAVSLGARLEWMKDASRSSYGRIHGVFRVNRQPAGGIRTRTMRLATEVPGPNGRRIDGGTTFYGGLGSGHRPSGVATDDALLAVRRSTGRDIFG